MRLSATTLLASSTIVIAAQALGTAPARATGTPEDVASTHAYIQADYALARASEARVGAAQARIEDLDRKLDRECRGAGAGSPENEASQPLSYEVAAALWSVAYGTDAGPIRAFLQAVRRLRWSERRLTRMAQSYATSLHELATLPLPDLCSDVRAWKASGFQTVPATTTRIDRHAEAIEGKTIPPRLLAPYERGADRSVLARATRLEAKLAQTEFVVGFNDWDQLLATLGLNQ